MKQVVFMIEIITTHQKEIIILLFNRDLSLGSLRNHDNDSNKNITNLHIWQWKAIDLYALHVHFWTFHRCSRSFYDVKWPVLQLWGRREHKMTKLFNFVFLSLKRWFQFNSRIVRTHFATVMTLNNSEMTEGARSYIFRWRSRCCRRRVCVNSLLTIRKTWMKMKAKCFNYT